MPIVTERGRKAALKTPVSSLKPGSRITTNQNVIRKWAEKRDGRPIEVKRTGEGGSPGRIRISFPQSRWEVSFEEISWDEFFRRFDEDNLAFLYQEKTRTNRTSRFYKLMHRK